MGRAIGSETAPQPRDPGARDNVGADWTISGAGVTDTALLRAVPHADTLFVSVPTSS